MRDFSKQFYKEEAHSAHKTVAWVFGVAVALGISLYVGGVWHFVEVSELQRIIPTCHSFTDYAEVLQDLKDNPGDMFFLDGNRDGIACNVFHDKWLKTHPQTI